MRRVALGIAALVALACTGLLGGDPVSVVDDYLRAGSDGRLDDALALVDPECHDHRPTANVAPTHVLGNRVVIDELELTLVDETAEKATVAYALKGHVPEGESSVKLGKIEITGTVGIGELDNSGTLELRRIGRAWKVTCR